MAKEFCLENMLFIEEYNAIVALNIKSTTPKLYRSRSSSLEVSQAVGLLFEKYVRPGAPFELNVSYEMSHAILIEIETGNVNIEMFTHLKYEIEQLIFRNTFVRFVESEQYQNSV